MDLPKHLQTRNKRSKYSTNSNRTRSQIPSVFDKNFSTINIRKRYADTLVPNSPIKFAEIDNFNTNLKSNNLYNNSTTNLILPNKNLLIQPQIDEISNTSSTSSSSGIHSPSLKINNSILIPNSNNSLKKSNSNDNFGENSTVQYSSSAPQEKHKHIYDLNDGMSSGNENLPNCSSRLCDVYNSKSYAKNKLIVPNNSDYNPLSLKCSQNTNNLYNQPNYNRNKRMKYTETLLPDLLSKLGVSTNSSATLETMIKYGKDEFRVGKSYSKTLQDPNTCRLNINSYFNHIPHQLNSIQEINSSPEKFENFSTQISNEIADFSFHKMKSTKLQPIREIQVHDKKYGLDSDSDEDIFETQKCTTFTSSNITPNLKNSSSKEFDNNDDYGKIQFSDHFPGTEPTQSSFKDNFTNRFTQNDSVNCFEDNSDNEFIGGNQITRGNFEEQIFRPKSESQNSSRRERFNAISHELEIDDMELD